MKQRIEKFSLLSLSLMLVSTFSPSAALPKMIAYYATRGYSSNQVELLFSIPSVAIMLMLFFVHWIEHHVSERSTIIGGILLLSLGGSLPMIWQNYPLVMLSRILLGLGVGLINSRAISIISEHYHGHERIKTLGLRGSFEVLGNAVLTALVGILILRRWSSAFAIYLFGLPILAFYLLCAPQPPLPVEEALSDKPSWKLTKADWLYLWGLALLAGFVININSAVIIRLPIMINERNLGTSSQSSLILSVMMLMGIIAGICFRMILLRFGKWLLPVLLLCLMFGLVLIGTAENIFLIILGALLSGFLYSLLVTASFTLLSQRISAESIGRATTFVLFFCNLGAASVSVTLNLFDSFTTSSATVFLIYAGLSLVLGLGLGVRSFRLSTRR